MQNVWVVSVHSYQPRSRGVGTLLFIKAQLPRISATDNFWKSLWTSVDSSSLMCRALAHPSFLISLMAHLCQAPRDSTAMGMKVMPSCWQGSWDFASFLLCAVVKAWPGVMAASCTKAAWRGFTTVTSSAASLPPAQCGINTSAGLPPDPGRSALPSLVGPRLAATAVLKSSSRSQLCLAILSPFQAQFRAWSPRRSLGWPQAGHGPSVE